MVILDLNFPSSGIQVEFKKTFSKLTCVFILSKSHTLKFNSQKADCARSQVYRERRKCRSVGRESLKCICFTGTVLCFCYCVATVTVYCSLVFFLFFLFPTYPECWHNMKDFWGLSWKLRFLKSCTQIHFDYIFPNLLSTVTKLK